MHFGLFSLMQRLGTPYTALFDEHLAEIIHAEDLGFDEAWFAEHHYNNDAVIPAPNLLVAALSQRTGRIRLGNMINVLPFHQPAQLAEELAMLDHLTHGRLNVGIGRGSRRLEWQRFGLTPEQVNERFSEAIQIIQGLWTQEPFSYRGKHYHLENLRLRPGVFQQPHPPLLTAVAHRASVIWAAQHRIGIAEHFTTTTDAKEHFALYRQLQAAAGDPDLPERRPRMFREIYIAPTDAQARAEAEPALWETWRLLNDRASYEEPYNGHHFEAQPQISDDQFRAVTSQMPIVGPLTYDQLIERGLAIIGSPETVIQLLLTQARELHLDTFVGLFAFGGLTHTQVTRSLDLFAREVMPALTSATAIQRA
ncbi:MAG TPA: LLM class flavin-dependent oxidoreductase [Ktedonobacterales bacterium]|jgi:alkanesulfonate monooxygenase SsuD/methylene tetrahydromethanopterin reductase-like flavin-dependent oxidoreductase (luciferase family)